MRRFALPYVTQPAVPVRALREFNQALEPLKNLRFPAITKLCQRLKKENEWQLDRMCDEVEELTKFVSPPSVYQNLHYTLESIPNTYKFYKEERGEKVKWLGYYVADIRRLVEALDKIKDHLSRILESIEYLMTRYLGESDWTTANPSIAADADYIAKEFGPDFMDNVQEAVEELEVLDEVEPLIRKYYAEEDAWLKYVKRMQFEMGNHEKVKPEGVEPLEVMWHVTTAYSKIMQGGFKTKDQLREEGVLPGGLGGGASDLISFTGSFEHAEAILKSMRTMSELAKSEHTAADIVSLWQNEGLSDEAIEKALEYRRIDDLDRVLPFDSARYLFEYLNMLASDEGIAYNSFFWSPDEQVFKNLDPDDIQIVEAVVRTDDPEVTYHWAEEEFRIPVNDIVSFGPVGTQHARLKELKKSKAAIAVGSCIYRLSEPN